MDANSTVPSEPTRVTVANVDLPFWSLVVLLLKVTFAAIPVAIILFIVAGMLLGFLSGFSR